MAKIQTAKNENCQKSQKLNLLVEFKEVEFSNRIKELKKLIKENNLKNFEIDPAQLKEFLSLFSEHHKFIALQLVKPFFSNTTELKNIELKSTQLVSVLSLFHTVSRGIVLETLIPMFVNSELTKLKKFELQAAQLKAILFLFANSDRLKAIKLLKENFDIKINLTETDIKDLETCLARDSDFKNLLSSDKKKIWNSFFVKSEEHSDIHSMPNKKVAHSFARPKIDRTYIFSHQNNFLQKRVNQNKFPEPLNVEIVKSKQLRFRLEFFKNYVRVHNNQSIVFKNAAEFNNFIKLFPPHDAIEFLKLPYIQDQIKNLQQQKILTKEAYTDLLNYLPENFNKRLLSPISPGTSKRSSAKISKVNDTDSKFSMPDLIPNVITTRGI